MTPPAVVFAGSLAQKPGMPGHAWFFLNWLLGLRQLGCEVLFVDWLSGEMCGGPVAGSAQARHLEATMRRYGLGDDYALLDHETGDAAGGVSRSEVVARAADSALLINVMGYLDDEEILSEPDLRAFLDIDPGFGQMWHALGLADIFAAHDAYLTVGQNIGRPDCSIPTAGHRWIPTRQPVVLDLWPVQPPGGGCFTSIGSWRGPFAPVEYEGTLYGQRVHEFRRFVELPRRVDAPFELALEIDSAEVRDLALLREHGWRLRAPAEAVPTLDAYQDYIQSSLAEFMVARGMYVQTRSGWFSDRSVCYLASGRPVLAQDTGLQELYPLGAGLLTFQTLEEAVVGGEEITIDQARHAAAAREIAEEFFDARTVLSTLLAELGIG